MILLSDPNTPKLFQKEKRIEIKPLSEIRKKVIKETLPEGLDNSEVHYQEKVQSAKQEFQQIKDQKEKMLEETRAIVAKEQDQWEHTKETLIKEAYNEGYHAGFATGEQDGLDQYRELLHQANQIVKSANGDYHAKLEKSEATIVDLAIHTSRKIMEWELQSDPSTLLSIIRTAIREIKDQPTVAIHVHPDYYRVVFQQKEELTRLVHGDTVLTVYADDELDTNGCVIEHPLGKIDASVDTQLQQLREVLHDIAMETGS